MLSDQEYMRQALSLARKGRGATRPNPCVGALIVGQDGEIAGRGWHRKAGEPHAEVEALADAARKGHPVKGGTAYVTLEPCNHLGRTGPCSSALIEAGVRRVVIAATDPNVEAGGGVTRMREAGVVVETGVLAEESRLLNAPFFISHMLGRPLVTLKWAMTLDGCTSTMSGDSKWITGEEARSEVHRRRAAHDAVLAGIGTVLQDEARLTIRNVAVPKGLSLWRIVLDSDLRLPLDAPFLKQDPISKAMVVCGEGADREKARALEDRGAEILMVKRGADGISMPDLAWHLHARSIQSVYVEGGRRVAGSFLQYGMADRVEAWMAPILAGGGEKGLGPVKMPQALGGMGEAFRLQRPEFVSVGGDWLCTGWLNDVLFG